MKELQAIVDFLIDIRKICRENSHEIEKMKKHLEKVELQQVEIVKHLHFLCPSGSSYNQGPPLEWIIKKP